MNLYLTVVLKSSFQLPNTYVIESIYKWFYINEKNAFCKKNNNADNYDAKNVKQEECKVLL